MYNEDKKIYAALAAIAVLLLSGFVWFFCAGRSDVSDIRRGAQSVTEQLDRAESGQREQAAALDRAENAADRSQSAIRDSEERVDRVQELERSDAEIIRESQSILDRVRERGKKEN